MASGEVIARVRDVLGGEPGVRWAYLFGSAARDGAFRDVDVAVMCAPDAFSGAVAWGGVIARLESEVGKRVDLIDLARAELPLVGPMLVERVLVIDREPQARRTWEAETTSRWLDFRPSYEEFLARRQQAMLARLGAQG